MLQPLLIAALFAQKSRLLSTLFHLGAVGLGLLSAVDASFVPLPIPGAADLMIALMAAREHNWLLLVLVSTLGSVAGGASCYYVGSLGGVHMVQKRVPAKYFNHLTTWVEEHAFWAVAIPAILPPPFPLIPFVMAAGALKMPPKKFYFAFAASRFARHAFFAWLGILYASHLRNVWKLLESPWATAVLVVFWIAVIGAVTYGIVKLVRTQRALPKNKRAAEAAV